MLTAWCIKSETKTWVNVNSSPSCSKYFFLLFNTGETNLIHSKIDYWEESNIFPNRIKFKKKIVTLAEATLKKVQSLPSYMTYVCIWKFIFRSFDFNTHIHFSVNCTNKHEKKSFKQTINPDQKDFFACT